MGNLRVQIEEVISNRTLILFVIYTNAGTRSCSVACAEETATTRIYSHLIYLTTLLTLPTVVLLYCINGKNNELEFIVIDS